MSLNERSYFHLREPQRVAVTAPLVPDNPAGVLPVWSLQVGTVQIAVVAAGIPPRPRVLAGAVAAPPVVVAVDGGKRNVVVASQRITFTKGKKNIIQ